MWAQFPLAWLFPLQPDEPLAGWPTSSPRRFSLIRSSRTPWDASRPTTTSRSTKQCGGSVRPRPRGVSPLTLGWGRDTLPIGEGRPPDPLPFALQDWALRATGSLRRNSAAARCLGWPLLCSSEESGWPPRGGGDEPHGATCGVADCCSTCQGDLAPSPCPSSGHPASERLLH